MTKQSYVYIIKNNASGKVYVGKSNNPLKRWHAHQRDSRNSNSLLAKAFKKYDKSCFEFFIIEEFMSEDLAYEAEAEMIEYLRFLGAELYNQNGGGIGGFRPSKEVIEKIRSAYKRDEKTLKKRSESIKKSKSDPTCRKRYSDIAKQVNNTLAARQRHSENAKRLWSDPIFRQKQAQSRKKLAKIRIEKITEIHRKKEICQSKCEKMSFLTREQAQLILDEFDSLSSKELSIRFNVSIKVITSLRARRTWKHLVPNKI